MREKNIQEKIQEKALSCKYFYFTPLGTALICRKKDKELKSVLHGIEWDGKECGNCTEYKPRTMKGGNNE